MSPTATAAPPPGLRTRRPTGRVAWPMIVVAGAEKTGKSHLCAEFSKSDLIGRLIWIPIGESDADSFGILPGVDFEIADAHDGTYRSILNTVRAAAAEPRSADGRPTAIVIDSISILWELLSDEAHLIARSRAAEKAARQNRSIPSEDADITVGHGLWNRAKDRWRLIIDTLRRHDGPVILCARLDEVTEFDRQGNPTRNRTWKVKAERNLSYDATAVVQLRSYRRPTLTAVRSLVMPLGPDEERTRPGLTLDSLLRDLGIEQTADVRPAPYTTPLPEAGLIEFEREAEERAQTNAAAAEMRRHAAAGTLPTPDEVTEQIVRALRDPNDPRSALLMVRSGYTQAVLEQVTISTKRGMVNASQAIDYLRSDLKLTADAVGSGTPPEPPTPDQAQDPGQQLATNEPAAPPTSEPAQGAAHATTSPAPTRPPSNGATTKRPNHRRQTEEKIRAALDKEAEYQALVQSVDLREYLADLLPADGDLAGISTYDLCEFVKEQRVEVVRVLIEAKEAATVAAYTKAGDGPCMNIETVFAACKMLNGKPAPE
ncbi:AAA family ATPase [Streptomyces noursei]|uniref:AAA family ATPase n=1 Tax=Streptomyces noursei TaxID=1971 RepID=UPI00344F863D